MTELLQIKPGVIRPVEIGKLVDEKDPVLRQVPIEWDFSNPPTPAIKFAHMLIDTAKAYGALGLAAPQIGYSYRVFCIGNDDQWQICFNPSIISTGIELAKGTEGCLSFPGLSLKINRPTSIKVKFYMPNGEERNEEYEGMTARCFQHELDHLNGVLFVDHVGEMSLLQAKQKRAKLIKSINRRNKKGT